MVPEYKEAHLLAYENEKQITKTLVIHHIVEFIESFNQLVPFWNK